MTVSGDSNSAGSSTNHASTTVAAGGSWPFVTSAFDEPFADYVVFVDATEE